MTLHNFRILCPSALLFRDATVRERSLKRSSFWTVPYRAYRSSYVGTFAVACMVDFHKWAATWRNKVDGFIALSAFAKEKFIEGGLEADRLFVKGNAVADPMPERAADAPARRGALYVGRLSEEKGVAELLAAWTNLDYPLRIAGDGPLRTLCERASGGNVTYLGRLSRDDVYAEMRRASFLVLPSVCYEMFPVTLVEAFANGLPVLASRLGSLRSLLDEGITGLTFDALHPEDIEAKARWAAEHSREMADMGVNARAVYEAKYTTEMNYRSLMAIYGQVAPAVTKGTVGSCALRFFALMIVSGTVS